MRIFSYLIKNVSYSNARISFFMRIFRIYAHLGISIQHFFYAIIRKMRIKIGGWKCS